MPNKTMEPQPFNLKAALDRVVQPSPPSLYPVSKWSGDQKKEWTLRKRQYSDDLSREFSVELEKNLRSHFPKSHSGEGKGTGAASAHGIKSVDVAFNIEGLFLGLGVSVKAVGLPEGTRGYGHNFKRLTEEWTTETILYHRYMPVSIVVGVLFMPIAAAKDRPKLSSLYYAAAKFKGFQGRSSIREDPELLEKIYVALFAADGETVFIDTLHDVPFIGVPGNAMTFEAVKDDLVRLFRSRNPKIRVKGMPGVTETGQISEPPPEIDEDVEEEL